MRGVLRWPAGLAILLLGVLGALAAAPEPPPAEAPHVIYQCPDADGNIIFQDDPCDVVKAAPKPAEPPKRPPAPGKPAAKPSSKSTAKPTPKAPEKAPQKTVAPPPSPANAPDVVKTKRSALPSVTVPPHSSGPLDARWATPDAALRTFVTAIDEGDRALVVSCLTGDALADLGSDPAALPLEELQAVVSSFTGYVTEGDLGPYWSIRALRGKMRPKWIFFERTGSGAWKVGGI